jgi:hypothetical protein
MEHTQAAARAAHARRNPDPAKVAERNSYLERQTDWSGTCQFCKKTLLGAQAELVAHRCEEYGEYLESCK